MHRAEVSVGPYRVIAAEEEWSKLLASYREKAKLAEDFPEPADGARSFIAIESGHGNWPELVVTQRYSPAGYGFHPGVLIVPPTDVVFIGAGERLLAYRLTPEPQRLWEDQAFVGFWSWSLHGDVVVMSAELQIAAWSASGVKLWTDDVEPPWTYEVHGDEITTDIMDLEKRTYSLTRGPRG